MYFNETKLEDNKIDKLVNKIIIKFQKKFFFKVKLLIIEIYFKSES